MTKRRKIGLLCVGEKISRHNIILRIFLLSSFTKKNINISL